MYSSILFMKKIIQLFIPLYSSTFWNSETPHSLSPFLFLLIFIFQLFLITCMTASPCNFFLDRCPSLLSFWIKLFEVFFFFFNESTKYFQVHYFSYLQLWERNGNPLQYSCLENPMDGGAWEATVHRVTRVGHNLATELLLWSLSLALYMPSISRTFFYSDVTFLIQSQLV